MTDSCPIHFSHSHSSLINSTGAFWMFKSNSSGQRAIQLHKFFQVLGLLTPLNKKKSTYEIEYAIHILIIREGSSAKVTAKGPWSHPVCTCCITPKHVNELAGPISASLRPGNPAPFKYMSQRLLAVGNMCPIWPARDLNLQPSAPEKKALPLNQLQVFLDV